MALPGGRRKVESGGRAYEWLLRRRPDCLHVVAQDAEARGQVLVADLPVFGLCDPLDSDDRGLRHWSALYCAALACPGGEQAYRLPDEFIGRDDPGRVARVGALGGVVAYWRPRKPKDGDCDPCFAVRAVNTWLEVLMDVSHLYRV
jgi:hypothetical protein